MTGWRARAEALAAELAASGAIQDPAWSDVFAATPRHLFVPSFWRLDEFNQPRTLIDSSRPEGRDEWLDHVYRNEVLVTHYRVLGSMPDGTEVRLATSSASAPRLVALMLDRLAVADGHRTLEIGTGTGYNAALLANRLGDQCVTSIEVDPTAAAEADERLGTAGLRPLLVVGDGAAGHPPRAPYDRIIATCAVARIPAAWVDQLADGGLMVVPLTFGGALAVLRKTGPATVSGRLDAEQTYFMALRAADEATMGCGVPDLPPERGPVVQTSTAVEPAVWADPDFRLWLALCLPQVRLADSLGAQGERSGVTVYTSTRRASVDYVHDDRDGPWRVQQDQTRLWDAVEEAWRAWLQYGRPARTRIGITAVSGGEQVAWLDSAHEPLRWQLSPRPA